MKRDRVQMRTLRRVNSIIGIASITAGKHAESEQIVALHVNLDKTTELRRETSTALSGLGKSLLVGHSTMRTGRSYSPRTLVSNLIGLPTMPSHRRHVSQSRV